MWRVPHGCCRASTELDKDTSQARCRIKPTCTVSVSRLRSYRQRGTDDVEDFLANVDADRANGDAVVSMACVSGRVVSLGSLTPRGKQPVHPISGHEGGTAACPAGNVQEMP